MLKISSESNVKKRLQRCGWKVIDRNTLLLAVSRRSSRRHWRNRDETMGGGKKNLQNFKFYTRNVSSSWRYPMSWIHGRSPYRVPRTNYTSVQSTR